MNFSISPDQVREAFEAGATLRLEAAAALISAYVNTQMAKESERVRLGQSSVAQFEFHIDQKVTNSSDLHEKAVEVVTAALKRAGFKATRRHDSEYDNNYIIIKP